MFRINNQTVNPSSYRHTLQEINQQPEKWADVWNIYARSAKDINTFLKGVKAQTRKVTPREKLRIILTGAGTSEYVGNILAASLARKNPDCTFESIATTNLVSNPRLYLTPEIPTLLVSFARSGNSPESLAAVALANQLVTHIFHLAITCAADGALAQQLQDKSNAYVMLMPEGTNDKGFAMTSSFSCMLLAATLVFSGTTDAGTNKTGADTDTTDSTTVAQKAKVDALVKAGTELLTMSDAINELADFDFDRIMYLGSGPLYGITNECRLKVLELSAGQVSSMYESSMGFRHGPKSWIDEKSFVVGLISNDPYTRQYDIDILNEVYHDQIAMKTVALTAEKIDADFEQLIVPDASGLDDLQLALLYVMVAQLISVITSVRVGNTPDTPSRTGTVNRVVKGVTIHKL